MYSLSYFQLSFICSQKHLGWFKCLLHYDSEEHNLRSIKTRQYHEMILFGACIWLKEDKGELYKISGRWEILTLVCSRAVLLWGGGGSWMENREGRDAPWFHTCWLAEVLCAPFFRCCGASLCLPRPLGGLQTPPASPDRSFPAHRVLSQSTLLAWRPLPGFMA